MYNKFTDYYASFVQEKSEYAIQLPDTQLGICGKGY